MCTCVWCCSAPLLEQDVLGPIGTQGTLGKHLRLPRFTCLEQSRSLGPHQHTYVPWPDLGLACFSKASSFQYIFQTPLLQRRVSLLAYTRSHLGHTITSSATPHSCSAWLETTKLTSIEYGPKRESTLTALTGNFTTRRSIGKKNRIENA